MNSTLLRGYQVSAAQVIDLAETMPFFADQRVIVVEETSFFEKAGEEEQRLAEYVGKVPQTGYLIFVERSPNASCKLYRAIAKQGWILRCDTPDEAYLREYAASVFDGAGLKISGRTLALFLEVTGTDMFAIRSEAEKLIGYCLGQGTVQEQDVRELCTPVIKDRVFDMIRAISESRCTQAMTIYMDLRRLQTPPQVILSLMLRQYLQLLQAGELLQTMEEKEAAARLKVSPWVLSNRLRPALRGHTRSGLESMVEACVRADQNYKSGKISPEIAVEELIVTFSQARGQEIGGQA